jgi:hypothetical protein
MEWKTVDSSQISEVGYDAASKTLGIRFKAKGKWPASEYHYSNVEPQTCADLMNAESIGGYLLEKIKSNPTAYPYTKIEAPVLLMREGETSGLGAITRDVPLDELFRG